MFTASASSRWFACVRVFNESRTSQVGSDPPAAASASVNARLTAFWVWASWRPTGVRVGRGMAAVYRGRLEIKAFDLEELDVYRFGMATITERSGTVAPPATRRGFRLRGRAYKLALTAHILG